MARVIYAGEFATEGERRAADVLKTLPAHWIVICNKILPMTNGSSFETDFIVVADQWIFLLDEKSWRGKITGNDQIWVRSDGSSTKSPLTKVDYVAKILAGYIRAKVPQLVGEFFVRGGVLLSTAEHLPILTGEPRAAAGIFQLSTICQRLRRLDQDGGTLRVQDFRDQIVKSLYDLSNVPAMPKQIGMYTIEELLTTRPNVRIFQAALATGDVLLPRTLMVYALDPHASDADSFYLREFDALRQLQNSGLVPKISDPFPWSDDFLVLPVEQLPGKSLAAHPRPETRDDLVKELLLAAATFRGLQTIHDNSVLHRALGPETVYVLTSGEKPRVAFNSFYAARVGAQSIAVSLDALAIEDPYAAPELAGGYGLATPQSDTYSLALIFLERIAGKRVTDLRLSLRKPAIVAPLSEQWRTLPDDVMAELTDIFDGIIAQPLAEQRWTAKEIADLLTGVAEQLRGENPAKSMPRMLDGRYEVQRILGKGTSATTYLALDKEVNKLVALKQFHNPQDVSAGVKAEWNTLTSVKSDRLPLIHETYSSDKDVHVKLEYIPGQTLQQVETEFPWSLDRWRSFAWDMLDALEVLEARDLLHRDIKPANIILNERDGRPVLIDCGFAVSQGAMSNPAGSGRYMPPEALTADSPPESSDRYALAVVFYRVLTGSYPDTVTDADALATLRLAARPNEEIAIAERLLVVLRQALSSDSSLRPPSATEFRTQLAQALQAMAVAPVAGAKPLRNPWVDQVRSLYRNSSVGNVNNRGLESDFVRETYIQTALDMQLLQMVFAQRPKAVFLSGNPGDGKTAFLERIQDELRGRGAQQIATDASGWEWSLDGHTFRSCYDASEANAGQSADQQLGRKLAELGGAVAPDVTVTVLVAINDGRLADFFERTRATFGWLEKRINAARREEQFGKGDVWVVDLKRRAFVTFPNGPSRSIAHQVLESLAEPKQWQICGNCAAQAICPLRANAAALSNPEIANRLNYLLLLTHLRRQRHITMRDLRSTLAFVITGDIGCDQVHAMHEGSDTSHALSDYAYWHSIFVSRDTMDDLSGDIAQLDPARLPQPHLDRFLYFHREPADTQLRKDLYMDERDLSPQPYATSSEWIAAVKRRLYFELRTRQADAHGNVPTISWRQLLPYRHADLFASMLQGRVDRDEVRRQLARGILRSDGINVRASAEHLGVKVSASVEHQLIVLKEFPQTDFVVEPHTVKGANIVEAIPETITFRHRSGTPTLELTLDLFELLLRFADGLQSDAPELRPLLEDLVPFKSALLLQETRNLVLIEGQGRIHRITQQGGKIVRLPATAKER